MSVFLAKQETYEPGSLCRTVDAAFSAYRFYDRIRPGTRVILKPNLILPSAPEHAAVTHPNVVAAAAKCLMEHGAEVLVAESGGGPYNPAAAKASFRVCGYAAAAEQTGFSLYTECKYREVSLPEGKRCGRLTVIEPFVRPGDLIVDIAKLKTHGMMDYSGAVKNLFGAVPGLMKPELHCRYPDRESFAEMIVDLCEYIRPDFSIIDGVVGMEGNGPTGGEPRDVGVLIASTSPYDCDLAGAEIIRFDPMDIPILKNAHERGLCAASSGEIEVLGAKVGDFAVADYRHAKSSDVDFLAHFPKFMRPALRRLTTPYPKIQKKACVGCGKCAESCPQHTITLREHKAEIDYSKCIRCFCCHEMCPKHVIEIRRFSLFNL